MHKMADSQVMSFNEISMEYPENYIVVEVSNINHSVGIEEGKAVYLCDSYEMAWDKAGTITNVRTVVLEGINRMSTVGVVL